MTTSEVHLRKRFPELTISNSGGSALYVNDCPGAPAASAILSQAVIAGETVYLAGQIALSPETSKMVQSGVEPETEQIFDNIQAVLTALDLTFADVIKASVYLTNFDEFAKFNEIYLRRMKGAKPAREALCVSKLALGATVEVTMTAYRPGGFGN